MRKQIDRLLSNQGIDVWAMFPLWINDTLGERRELVVARDWTDFDADDQTTLPFSHVTAHGRATPLLWFSVFKAELAGKRNVIDDMCLSRLRRRWPRGRRSRCSPIAASATPSCSAFVESWVSIT
jgi:hypothetical protein